MLAISKPGLSILFTYMVLLSGCNDDGDRGSRGLTGPAGADGSAGPGVAEGGSAGQVLAKSSASDFATEWVDLPGKASIDWSSLCSGGQSLTDSVGCTPD